MKSFKEYTLEAASNKYYVDAGEYDYEGDMARTQLQTLVRNSQELVALLEPNDNLPEWVQSKITLAQDYISTVRDYLMSRDDLGEAHSTSKIYDKCWDGYRKVPGKKPGESGSCAKDVKEAEYHGREVPLGKPMAGDVKKSKVFVKDPSTGNVKKVNFGDKTLSIKKHIPARKKSYCARSSGQGNLTDKTKANYWSRRAWDCK